MSASRRRSIAVILGAQLGNQMFQYAAGRALASAQDAELLLCFPPGSHDYISSSYRLRARVWADNDDEH
jgi:hypothetical protein